MGTDEPFIECFSLVGKADFLVTGDKSGLLFLKTHQGTRILTAADFTPQFI
jgi:predicted nucleic acid-binding protein